MQYQGEVISSGCEGLELRALGFKALGDLRALGCWLLGLHGSGFSTLRFSLRLPQSDMEPQFINSRVGECKYVRIRLQLEQYNHAEASMHEAGNPTRSTYILGATISSYMLISHAEKQGPVLGLDIPVWPYV